MEKDYEKELHTMSVIAYKYSNFKTARKLNTFLESEKVQKKDSRGLWRFNKEYSHFEKYQEKQVGSNTRILARKITYEGLVFIIKLLEKRRFIKW